MDYEYFMSKALDEARKALSTGEFPVGCVIVYEDRVIVTGTRFNSATKKNNELDHAEMVALKRFVEQAEGIDRQKVAVFSTLEPCLMCHGALILNGIRHIIYAYEDVLGGGTGLDLATLNPLYREMKVTVVPGVLRHESLVLLKEFFSDPDNDYLRGSLLAQHALRACAKIT